MAELIQKQHKPTTTDETIDEMPPTTESDVLDTIDDALDTIDDVLDGADDISDDVLLTAVRDEKVQTVRAHGRSTFQSGQSQAWTMGGNVD